MSHFMCAIFISAREDSIMDMRNKIRCLFTKAAKTHSEYEACAAILKAHELMVKYGIENVEDEDNVKYAIMVCEYSGSPSFRQLLGKIIADNFRVRCFLRNQRVAFFGREENVLTAKQTFEYTYAFIRRESGRIYRQVRKTGRNGTGVVNSYALGFCRGLKDKLDSQSVALMVVTPTDVDKKFEAMSHTFRKARGRISTAGYSPDIYERGRKDGREVLDRRRIEGKTVA